MSRLHALLRRQLTEHVTRLVAGSTHAVATYRYAGTTPITAFQRRLMEEPVRKVIVQEFVTLNGLAAEPNDSVDYIPASTRGDKSFGQEQLALLEEIDTILLGRVTYAMFAGFWPHVTNRDDEPFADKLNSIPKVVFSRTLDRAPWGTWNEARVVKDDAIEEVAELKRQPGKNMIV